MQGVQITADVGDEATVIGLSWDTSKIITELAGSDEPVLGCYVPGQAGDVLFGTVHVSYNAPLEVIVHEAIHAALDVWRAHTDSVDVRLGTMSESDGHIEEEFCHVAGQVVADIIALATQ